MLKLSIPRNMFLTRHTAALTLRSERFYNPGMSSVSIYRALAATTRRQATEAREAGFDDDAVELRFITRAAVDALTREG